MRRREGEKFVADILDPMDIAWDALQNGSGPEPSIGMKGESCSKVLAMCVASCWRSVVLHEARSMPNLPGFGNYHLLVALTPHGYGHAAMTAPVVNTLRRRLPGLRLTLQTTLPRPFLENSYDGIFEQIDNIPDFGLCMGSATEVLIEASARRYQELHAGLDALVAQEADRLARLGIDLVLANIPYVTLLAARKAGIRAMALSCLNWAAIYHAYCGDRPEAPAIEAEMLTGYRSAQVFLTPQPAMAMPDLGAILRPIGPLARRGTPRRRELRDRLGLSPDIRLGLVAFGGMETGWTFRDWPRLDGWHWIVTSDPEGRPDLIFHDKIGMQFSDLFCSCDAVIGKPGYGTFAEAGVGGVPLLSLSRPDWPETAGLLAWLTEHGRCLEISRESLFDPGTLAGRLDDLLSLPEKLPAEPSGAEEAADWLEIALTGRDKTRS